MKKPDLLSIAIALIFAAVITALALLAILLFT